MSVRIVKIAWKLPLEKTIKVREKFQNHKFEKNFKQSLQFAKKKFQGLKMVLLLVWSSMRSYDYTI
jgi:hypothetical protein